MLFRYLEAAIPTMSPNNLNILESCFSSSWGGLEIHTLHEISLLRQRGHRVWCACRKGSQLHTEAVRRGIQSLPLSVTGYVHPLAVLRLGRALKQLGIQVIHCQLSKDIATLVPAMLLTRRKIPIVLSRRMGSAITKKDFFHRFTYRHVSRVLAISNVIHQNVIDTTPMHPENVITLHHGINTEEFSPDRVDRAQIRKELGIEASELVIGFVGRFSPGKGHEEFLRAASMLAGMHPQVRFLVVGEASFGEEEYERGILALCKDLGLESIVRFIGFRADIASVMAAFDIFAFPSHAESFGSVLIEAMAMELPSVATNSDGVLDIVVDGETGVFVPPRDAGALAGALARLIEDPQLRLRLGRAAREHVKRFFGEEKLADGLERIYFSLV